MSAEDQVGLFDPEPGPEDDTVERAAAMWGKLPPHVRTSDTSLEAARSMVEIAPTHRLAVFSFLVSRGDRGATDDEIERALGLRHQSASARRRELVQAGLVEETEERRKTRSGRTATVWEVPPRVRARVNGGGP